MPGTYVKDALEPVLQNGTINANATGSAVQVDFPHDVQVVATVTGAVTGTTPTLDIEVQGADDSGFTTNVVSYGRFGQLVTADQNSAKSHVLQARVYKKYMRIKSVVGGTSPVFTTTKVVVRPREYQRVAASTTA